MLVAGRTFSLARALERFNTRRNTAALSCPDVIALKHNFQPLTPLDYEFFPCR
jgi:hypothetical protein